MPVKIPDALPATKVLQDENIFVMPSGRASEQDIRPLHIGIVNLMPTKEVTETQLLRLLGNTPLQIEVVLINMSSHHSRNTSGEHLGAFYRTFDEVKQQKFDGLIITGAPVEMMPFEQVDYWEELTSIMDWAAHNVFSTLYICWAAQAGLYYHYGIHKHPLSAKMFGVFEHEVLNRRSKLMRGFDDRFLAPHSRYTEVRAEDILACEGLELLATSPRAGTYLVESADGRQVFVTGHSEYDYDTLALEYRRDVDKGLSIPVPENYFPDDNPKKEPEVRWRAHANLLFGNWLNYYVYQETPYDIGQIG